MKEIENKLNELAELLKVIPQESKGTPRENIVNRHKFLLIRSAIDDLINKLKKIG